MVPPRKRRASYFSGQRGRTGPRPRRGPAVLRCALRWPRSPRPTAPPSPTTTSGDGRPIGAGPRDHREPAAAWDPVLAGLAERVAGGPRRRARPRRVRPAPPYDAVTLAGDVRAVVDALGLDEPLMVGHSMGGVVVSAYGGLGHPARGDRRRGPAARARRASRPRWNRSARCSKATTPSFREPRSRSCSACSTARCRRPSGRGSTRRRVPEQDVVLGVWAHGVRPLGRGARRDGRASCSRASACRTSRSTAPTRACRTWSGSSLAVANARGRGVARPRPLPAPGGPGAVRRAPRPVRRRRADVARRQRSGGRRRRRSGPRARSRTRA